MSGEQPPNLTEAYGQAILYGYLIEDVLNSICSNARIIT